MTLTEQGSHRAELEGQNNMTSLYIHEPYEAVGFLGVWEEEWHTRATIASKAERYRAWLRAQGCSRDEAAELVVRFLASQFASLRRVTPGGEPTVH